LRCVPPPDQSWFTCRAPLPSAANARTDP
jgi:hypothetical protein